jgi:23S rRNA pseudouridine2605 synthase
MKSMSAPRARRVGVARVLSKAGVCSRTQAAAWVAEGRVAVNGRVVRDPEHAVADGVDRVTLDGAPLPQAARRYIALNKPRGLVTTASDDQGRDTVYRCFDGAGLPWLAPVGRLDRASEGLLLFSNDPEWAARITEPAHGLHKIYHVQVDAIPDAALLERLHHGENAAHSVALLRAGAKNAWLEIVLDEGRNRQIRRLLAACDLGVLRLVRIAVGPVRLGELAKGEWRELDAAEVSALQDA